MKRILIIIFMLLCMATGSNARGIDPKADSVAVQQMRERMEQIRQYRPTVALVLSGGGAKGLAHIGVIRYVESLGIPVDMVLGTSMGGLVGGLYALGYSVDQMEEIVRSIDWNWVFTDKVSRKYVSYADTKYKEKYMLSIPFYYEKDYYRMKMMNDSRFDPMHKYDMLNIGADNEGGADFFKKNLLGSLPSGYIFGQNVSNLISSLTIGYQDSIDFKDLPVPYACIAADMVSGKAKIWHGGRMNDAMRSTMSIPGVFAPVRLDGMVLVDGGLRDNYPTALAREMGADIIIGVDLSDPRKTYLDVNNIGDIIGQGIEMMMRDGIEKNLLIPDVKIKPDLKGFHMMSFSPQNADTIMVRGYEAALAQDTLLREVALRTAGIYTPAKKRPALGMSQDSLVIANVEITGVLPREKEILKDRLDLKYGEKISRQELYDIVARIYGTQAYDYVTYGLEGKDEPFDLVLNCRKGPIHQFGLGVRADTEEIVSVMLNVGLNVHKLHGHMFDLSAKISANPYASFHWSYDIPKFPTFNGLATIRWTDLNMLNLGNNRLNFNYLSAKQELYLSNIKWKQLDGRVGIRNEVVRMGRVLTDIHDCYNCQLLSNDFVSGFLDVGTYTFDDGYFPTRGVSAGLSYSWTFTGFPKRFDNFHTLAADAKVVLPIGDIFAFIPSFDCRFLLGDNVPLPFLNAVGGSLPSRYLDQQMPFVGVTHLSAMKNILTIYRADLRFKVAKNHYLTGIVNYLRDSDSFMTYTDGPGYFGTGVEYAFDTIFGPLAANVHWSNLTGKVGFYISAGYNF